ncbi:GNAT family N-acetyltransferase [Demequina zhanjiangensis]|uniref:GNAT family N-acetyltransferase n=1 Tax=Demequina zhanjiangensis TaxID=3051659 RepID=A0ABT8G3L3_9MICO|nr:GNAT family N-acetyltransferase [Demequina sp. SYSU T00b26]MDN4473731.1 GNAT family N-acetyltransferase [Demequina sp. SYSU T00b26]
MALFADEAEHFWLSPYQGESLVDTVDLHLLVNPDLRADRPVEILGRPHHAPQVSVAPQVADAAGFRDDHPVDAHEARARIASAGYELTDPDLVYLFRTSIRTIVENETPPTTIRLLRDRDADVFAAFLEPISEEDIDLAYVELDHWAVMGAFEGDDLAAAASAYPWGGGPMADIGVLTSPWHRSRGHGRRVVRALAAHCWQHGYEPQYRTQPDNVASQSSALAAGLEHFGDWECVPLGTD